MTLFLCLMCTLIVHCTISLINRNRTAIIAFVSFFCYFKFNFSAHFFWLALALGLLVALLPKQIMSSPIELNLILEWTSFVFKLPCLPLCALPLYYRPMWKATKLLLNVWCVCQLRAVLLLKWDYICQCGLIDWTTVYHQYQTILWFTFYPRILYDVCFYCQTRLNFTSLYVFAYFKPLFPFCISSVFLWLPFVINRHISMWTRWCLVIYCSLYNKNYQN